jgi:hypothetical protein
MKRECDGLFPKVFLVFEDKAVRPSALCIEVEKAFLSLSLLIDNGLKGI